MKNYKIAFVINGKSEFNIVIPTSYTPAEEYAAKELQHFVKECTGAKLIIKDEQQTNSENTPYFSVGRTCHRDKYFSDAERGALGDGFILKNIDGNIFVDAVTDRGFIYGVYEFIERYLGVRFLTADCTVTPKKKNVIVKNLNIKSVPSFKLRTFLNYPAYPFGKDEVFSTRNRTLHNWFVFDDKFGGKVNVFSRKCGTHNARYFVPAEKYGTRESTGYTGEFDKDHQPHPEFYHSMEGHVPNWENANRGPTIDWANGITADGKLDESMEISVAKIVIEEMKKDVLANPHAEFFLFDQEDFVEPVTDKSLIEKYKASGVVIRFCNVVATELQKWADKELNGRRINLVTFAYQQTMYAPVKTNDKGEYEPIDQTVIPVDNLYIRLAYMSFHYYPYGDYRQPKIVLDMTNSWGAVCKHFWFWGYDSIFNDYYVYNPTFKQAEGTVKLMERMGVEYFIMLSSYDAPNDWQADLKNYFWMKLLWDTNKKIYPLRDEYLNGYYGSYAKYVKDMIKCFDKRYDKVVKALEVGHDEYNCYHEIGVPKNINSALIEKALYIITKGEEKLKRNKKLSEQEKEQMLIRLLRVKVTPLWMKYKYYNELYSSSDIEGKTALLKEIIHLTEYTNMKQKEEAVTLKEFLIKSNDEIYANIINKK